MYYDALNLISRPWCDSALAPLHKSSFSHRHRLAWALLDEKGHSSVVASRLHLPHLDGQIRYVRCSLRSLIPAHAAVEDEYKRMRPVCEAPGDWSCKLFFAETTIVPMTNLTQLREQFGEHPHRYRLPRPTEYGSHAAGYAAVSRKHADASHSWSTVRTGSVTRIPVTWHGQAFSLPPSCLFALIHFIPARYLPSACWY